MYGVIYKSTNIVNGKVYIGQTTMEFKDRVYQHIHKIKYVNTIFSSAIKKYGADNFIWDIIDSAENRSELNEKEIYWINYFKSYVGFDDCNWYNMTLGGEGFNGFEVSEEAILKKSGLNSHSAKMTMKSIKELLDVADSGEFTMKELAEMFSIHHSSISAIFKKITYKKELSMLIEDKKLLEIRNKVLRIGELDRRNKIRNGNKGKTIDKKSKEKSVKTFLEKEYGKPVLQIDIKSRKIISEYNSIRKCAIATGISEVSISQCCRGVCKYSNGFIWIFKDNYNENEIRSRDIETVNKSVVQIDIERNIVEIHDSIKDGADKVNGDSSAITKCCKGKANRHKGFKWVYLSDYLEGGNIV